MGNILNFTLDDGRYGVKKHPVLNNLTGSDTATDLLIKIVAYLIPRGNTPFYKFNGPAEKPNPLYRKRDSFTEELRISMKKFENARKKIAVRYYSGGTKGITREEAIKSNYLVLYRMDAFNTIWYELNPRFYNLFCADIWNEENFIHPNGDDKNKEELLVFLNEYAELLENGGILDSSCVIDLEGVEPQLPKVGEVTPPKKEPAEKADKPVYEAMVNGTTVACKLVKATLSDPPLLIPALDGFVRMHEDFAITAAMKNYFIEKGCTEEEIDTSVVNHILYWSRTKKTRPGWWRTWYDNFVTNNFDSKGRKKSGKYDSKLNASQRQVEQFRKLAEDDGRYDDLA